MTRHKPLLLDLFSGCGGASLGFKLAGCKIAGAIDINASACRTFEYNLKVKPIEGDLRTTDGAYILKEFGLKKGDLDIVLACPPCQSFSSLRRTSKGNEVDARDDLIIFFAKRVAEIQPRIVVFENVSGIVGGRGKAFLEFFFQKMKKLGYKGVSGIVNTASHGIPQFRKRLIALFIKEHDRSADRLALPKQTHFDPRVAESLHLRPWLTVRDAIGDLPPLESGEAAKYPPNHVAPKHSEKVLKIIRSIPKDGGSRSSLPKKLWLRCHKDLDGAENVYGRMSWSKPGPTITSRCTTPSCGRFIHPEQDRAITPREAARIQSFPDYFIFNTTLHATTQQIGNAMPVNLATAMGEELVRL